MKVIDGYCQKCGAPYYVESPWLGVVPPAAEPTCMCWNVPQMTTSTSVMVNPRIDDEPKPTPKSISWVIAANRSSPFYVRKHFAVVSNVSWGLLPWEADMLVCSKAGYLTEIEIKVSMSDWRQDRLKGKWGPGWSFWKRVKQFYYAAPPEVAERWSEIELPETAGILSVAEHGGVKVLREAAASREAVKLKDSEMLQLARLGSMKAWKVTHQELVEESRL